jgi:hypothetical protein
VGVEQLSSHCGENQALYCLGETGSKMELTVSQIVICLIYFFVKAKMYYFTLYLYASLIVIEFCKFYLEFSKYGEPLFYILQ